MDQELIDRLRISTNKARQIGVGMVKVHVSELEELLDTIEKFKLELEKTSFLSG